MECQLDCSSCPDMHCNAKIEFKNLCVRKVKACCVDSEKIVTRDLCADKGSIIDLDSKMACVDDLKANRACVLDLKVNSLQQCGKYRATVVYSAPSVYTLGSQLEFDVILDDPNNNVVLGLPWASYTVPLSGYYMVTLETDLTAFVIPGDPILGTPVGHPQILVNGLPYRESFTPFLAFHNGMRCLVSTLISVNAGDTVTSLFDAIAQSDTGFIDLVGTATISGNGSEAAQSVFKIHYMSSNCPPNFCSPCESKGQCVPCPTMNR